MQVMGPKQGKGLRHRRLLGLHKYYADRAGAAWIDIIDLRGHEVHAWPTWHPKDRDVFFSPVGIFACGP
jgi:hypothetical protein